MTVRIIAKLDIKNQCVIKGINYEGFRVLGNPQILSNHYYQTGIDEIIYLDFISTYFNKSIDYKTIKSSTKNTFIPITVGGGVATINSAKDILVKCGADKVAINSALFKNLSLLEKLALNIGSSNITCMVEVVKYNNIYYLTSNSGREIQGVNINDWLKKLQDYGAGEILFVNVSQEGLGEGFDIKIIEKIRNKIEVPLIVNGGAGNFRHILNLLKSVKLEGVAISSMFHYNSLFLHDNRHTKTIGNFSFLNNLKYNPIKCDKNIIINLKKFLKKNRINVR
jgi:cyclase